MPFTTITNNNILKYLFGQTGFTPPSNFYIALSKTQPNVNGTGVTEPSGGGYARVQVANTTTNWTTSTASALSNSVQVEFADSTADWGTITYICLYDAITGGNLIGFGALTSAKTVQSTTTVLFAPSTLNIAMS